MLYHTITIDSLPLEKVVDMVDRQCGGDGRDTGYVMAQSPHTCPSNLHAPPPFHLQSCSYQ